jgi:hypothetical protein
VFETTLEKCRKLFSKVVPREELLYRSRFVEETLLDNLSTPRPNHVVLRIVVYLQPAFCSKDA